jgi:type II secretion system protein N
MKKKLLLILAYSAFTLFAGGLMLLWKFPHDDFVQWLLHKTNTPQSPVVLHVDSAAPSFLPPGVRLQRFTVSPKAWHTTFAVENLRLSIPISDLLRGRPGVKAGGDILGGYFSGALAVDNVSSPQRFFCSLSTDSCNIATIPQLARQLNANVTGSLACDIQLQGRAHPVAVDSGHGSAELHDVVVNASMPFLKGGALPLGDVDLNFTMDGRRIKVTECRFNSDQIKGELTGVIIPGNTLANTSVDLKGTYKISPDLLDTQRLRNKSIVRLLQHMKQMPLRITGKLPSLYVGFF